jgi:hypothetical protein
MKPQLLPIFTVLRHARDSRLTDKNSELILLYGLILRCDPKKEYSTFVGYDQLCLDTGCNRKTVQTAAGGLEQKGLIKRRLRHNQSNLWFVNVPQLKDAAITNLAADAVDDDGSSPFDLTSLVENATPVASSKEVTPDAELAPRSNEDAETIAEIKTLLQDRFGDHATYRDPKGEQFMSAAVEKMVAQAGHPMWVFEVFNDMPDELKEEVEPKIMASEKLGGYLQKCFSGWLQTSTESSAQEWQGWLQKICQGDGNVLRFPSSKYARFQFEGFITYLKAQLGDDLLGADTEDDGDQRVLTISITDAAREHILAEAKPKPEAVGAGAGFGFDSLADDLD